MSLKIPTYTKQKLLNEINFYFPDIKHKDILTIRKLGLGTTVSLKIQEHQYEACGNVPGKAYLNLLQKIRKDINLGLLKFEIQCHLITYI